MTFDQWAVKWNISHDAIQDFRNGVGLGNDRVFASESDGRPSTSGRAETAIQSLVRLEASRKGCRLWRNNVGATYTKDGAFIRYGLANESKSINSQLKSADLIGIRPVIITPEMVGMVIGQFLSREIKHGQWRYVGNDRERAQLAWAELILSLGGDAGFAINEGTI